MRIPAGSAGMIKGLHYKIGRFGLAYYWNTTGEWIRSQRKAPEVQALIDRMAQVEADLAAKHFKR